MGHRTTVAARRLLEDSDMSDAATPRHRDAATPRHRDTDSASDVEVDSGSDSAADNVMDGWMDGTDIWDQLKDVFDAYDGSESGSDSGAPMASAVEIGKGLWDLVKNDPQLLSSLGIISSDSDSEHSAQLVLKLLTQQLDSDSEALKLFSPTQLKYIDLLRLAVMDEIDSSTDSSSELSKVVETDDGSDSSNDDESDSSSDDESDSSSDFPSQSSSHDFSSDSASDSTSDTDEPKPTGPKDLIMPKSTDTGPVDGGPGDGGPGDGPGMSSAGVRCASLGSCKRRYGVSRV